MDNTPKTHPRIVAVRLGCNYAPPALSLIYEDLKYNNKKRFRMMELDVRITFRGSLVSLLLVVYNRFFLPLLGRRSFISHYLYTSTTHAEEAFAVFITIYCPL
jgi:hypothetical protein